MDECLILGFMLGRDGWTTYLEAMAHFEEVAPSDFRLAWERLVRAGKIGWLCLDRVPQIHRGEVVYSVGRADGSRWTVDYHPAKVLRRQEATPRPFG